MFDGVLENQLSFIVAQLPADIFVKDRRGVYLACSDGLAKKAGFTCAAELVGKTDFECHWKNYADSYLINDLRVMERGEPELVEEMVSFFDEPPVMVKTTKSPYRDAQGQVIGVVGHCVQVSHTPEMQYLSEWYYFLSGERCSPALTTQQLCKKIRHYLEFMINQIPMNVFWLSIDGTILGYNQALRSVWNGEVMASEQLGRSPYVGMRLEELLPPDVAEEVLANNAKTLASDKAMVFEETVKTIDNEQKIFLSYKTPIYDDEQNKIGLMGVSVDITDRKKMEEDLWNAKENAEAAHWAKIQFLKNMRHDVRTPLSCITGSIKILKKMEHDPEKLEFLDGVLYSSENLLKMLTRMLEYDHIQSNERPLQYQSFKLRVLIRDLVEMFAFTARQKGLALHCDISEDVPEYLVTDYYRFQRVILNLVNNAIKFTHEGHIGIRLGMDNPETLLCAINDTGIGIEESKKEVVFQKHVRLVGADQGQYQGEGLGLSIVKQFVEELGGSIELESKLNEGSTFTVLLSLQSLPISEVTGQEVNHEGVTG